MTDEEAAFQAILDANPEDFTTRLVFSEWLRDRDDPRADGIQALGDGRYVPNFEQHTSPWNVRPDTHSGCWSWWQGAKPLMGIEDCQMLPLDWHDLVETTHIYTAGKRPQQAWAESREFHTRRAAEDAAALAFSKLPAERRAELLSAAAPV